MLKKLSCFLMIFIFLISLISCTDDDDLILTDFSSETSIEEKESSSQEETTSEDVTSEESSEEEYSSEESSSEEDTKTDTPPLEITENGNFSTVKQTVQSYDRLRQMNNSKSVYNVGSTYSESEIKSAKSSAEKIVLGGSFTYKNAAGFMKHYLDGTGENYIIDVATFMQDSVALQNRNQDINKALRACENLAKEGESVTVYQMEESIFHNLSGDWRYALGSYFSSIEIIDLTYDGTTYNATLKYKVTDFYNWDANDDKAVFTGTIAYIVGEISPKDLHQLHRVGQAQEFLSVGEISYEISWTQGQSIEQILK